MRPRFRRLILTGTLRGLYNSGANLPIDETDLVAWWKLDEESDGSGAVTRVDATGQGRDLTDINTCPSDTGHIGSAAQFIRADAAHLSHADATWMDRPNDAATWVFWWKAEATNSNMTLFSKASGSNREVEFQITGATTKTLNVFTSEDGTATSSKSSRAAADGTTKWQFVALVFDAGAGDVFTCYHGTEDGGALQVDTSSTDSDIFKGTAEWRLGDNQVFASDYDGLLDEFGYFDRALTTGEVEALYNSGAGVTYG